MLARAPQSLRSHVARVHISAPVRYAHGHGEYHFPGNKRAAFAVKLSAFLLAGFSIPFVAAVFQLKKAAA
ncbi:hypothetical protein SCLCIDRAFT_884864 [Scleroderma citrinum Foug A]|uniref:Cytochrome c oxidase subunit 8, mitochondrial n=1 Tax=Scleroderma citrinum Foug A TaxID=1036808 RepID=A0A0C3AUJ2_9AGAM|nr:hypothetical protein SCLCIDRAFT_884864 [Scleroderma citrinum Foug A]